MQSVGHFAAGLLVPTLFMVVELHGLLFLPSDDCTMLLLTEMGWMSDSLLVLVDCSVRLKGSDNGAWARKASNILPRISTSPSFVF